MLDLFNLYLTPFRMPVFFFISGYLIAAISTAYRGEIVSINASGTFLGAGALGRGAVAGVKCAEPWLAPERDLSNASNAAYADSTVSSCTG